MADFEFPESRNLTINVNLSVRQCLQPDLLAEVSKVLQETGLAPERLKLDEPVRSGRGEHSRTAMIFHSLAFVLFFTFVTAVYWRLPLRAQNIFLLAASYLSSGWGHPWFASRHSRASRGYTPARHRPAASASAPR